MKTPLLIFVLPLLLFCCKSKNEITPTSGKIKGSVKLTSQNSTELKDHSGVKIEIAGPVTMTAVSEMNGDWETGDKLLPSGTYDITYSKSGHGTFKQFSVQHTGGPISTVALASKVVLSEISTLKFRGGIKAQTMNTTEGIQIIVDGMMDWDPSSEPIIQKPRAVVLFLKKDANPTSEIHDASVVFLALPYAYSSLWNTSIAIAKTLPKVKSGDRIYISAHTLPRDYITYIDPATWLTHYVSVSLEGKTTSVEIP